MENKGHPEPSRHPSSDEYSPEANKHEPKCHRCNNPITFDTHLRSATTSKCIPLNLDLTPHHCHHLTKDEESMVLTAIRWINWLNGMLPSTSLKLIREAKA